MNLTGPSDSRNALCHHVPIHLYTPVPYCTRSVSVFVQTPIYTSFLTVSIANGAGLWSVSYRARASSIERWRLTQVQQHGSNDDFFNREGCLVLLFLYFGGALLRWRCNTVRKAGILRRQCTHVLQTYLRCSCWKGVALCCFSKMESLESVPDILFLTHDKPRHFLWVPGFNGFLCHHAKKKLRYHLFDNLFTAHLRTPKSVQFLSFFPTNLVSYFRPAEYGFEEPTISQLRWDDEGLLISVVPKSPDPAIGVQDIILFHRLLLPILTFNFSKLWRCRVWLLEPSSKE
jgi:hypothetical protein